MKSLHKKISLFFSKYVEKDFSFFPLISDVKKYQVSNVKNDLLSAFSIALLAIPQAIAYSLLAGLPPSAGLLSAIFGTIFVASFGSSKQIVSGPTTGMAILIQTTLLGVLDTYYPNISGIAREEIALSLLMQMVFLIGILQMSAGFFKLGKALQFVSRPVVLGYFAGVAIAIVTNQLFYFMDIPYSSSNNLVISKIHYLIFHINEVHLLTFLLGVGSFVLLIGFRKRWPKWPIALFLLIGVSVLSYLFNSLFHATLTEGKEHYWHISNLGDLGTLEAPFLDFAFPKITIVTLNIIFPSALAIALLGILETFSVSTALSAKTGERICTNQQMFALGVGNTFLAFLMGAMPTSGSISRSMVNQQSGAKTRFAAMVSGLFVALMVYIFWPYIKHIPLVALATILFAVVPSLINIRHVKLCFKATKGDAIVFLLTMATCLFFSLNIAFYIGIIISIASYLQYASVPHLVEFAFNPSGRLQEVNYDRHVHRRVRVIGLGGELFFATVEFFQQTLFSVAQDPFVKAIVLRLDGVYHMDVSMCFALLHLHEYLKEKKQHLVISGISEEIWNLFFRTGIIDKVGKDSIFLSDETKPQLSTWRACLRANELISTK